MKLYKLELEHSNDEIEKEFYIVCNSVSAVIDYSKTLGLHHIDYEIASIKLITNNVAISDDV